MKLMNIMMVITMLYKPSVRPTIIHTKKICKDCKFFIANNMECSRFGQVDLVTGKKTYEYARNTRIDEDKCGETANGGVKGKRPSKKDKLRQLAAAGKPLTQ